MLDVVLNFLQEQGILVILGLLVAGGIFGQAMASVRFRKLRKGIQSLAVLQTPGQQGAAVRQKQAGKERIGRAADRNAGQGEDLGETMVSHSKRKRDIIPDTAQDNVQGTLQNNAPAADSVTAASTVSNMTANTASDVFPNAASNMSSEVDSQLLYLKQSLDRIAAGRDQKLEEENRTHRKLTPAEEQIIVDILKEYLS